MAETGELAPDARVELLDGVLHDMSPIEPFHGGVVNRLNLLFNQLARGRWLVSVQNPLHLDEYSEPEPDLMLLEPVADSYVSRHPGPQNVFLVVEVADSSLAYDRGEKLSAYVRAGVGEVWLIALQDRTLEIHREPAAAGYASASVLRCGDVAYPSAFPDVAVEITGLLGQH